MVRALTQLQAFILILYMHVYNIMYIPSAQSQYSAAVLSEFILFAYYLITHLTSSNSISLSWRFHVSGQAEANKQMVGSSQILAVLVSSSFIITIIHVLISLVFGFLNYCASS